jgi:hypothetical protein
MGVHAMTEEKRQDVQAEAVARRAFAALFVPAEKRTLPERAVLALALGDREQAQELSR